MANYAERIAYWYFRLNGFFSVQDFVHHRDHGNSADSDLLALRLKNSFEMIDGNRLELDNERLAGLFEGNRNAAIVVQVKSGRTNEPGQAFNQDRLCDAIRFLGVVPEASIEETVRRLTEHGLIRAKTWNIAKVFVAEEPEVGSWIRLRLCEMEGFVRARLGQYAHAKLRARYFFPDELMQYFAWKAGAY